MRPTLEIRSLNWRLLALVLSLLILPYLIGKAIASESYFFLLLFIFSTFILVLYTRQIELFILMALVINHNLFYLLPTEALGKYNYSSLLLVVLFITIAAAVFMKLGKGDISRTPFGLFIYSFLIILAVGAFNSFFAGQPLVMGIKKAIVVYSPILFYFIFLSRRINIPRLLDLVVITGVGLAFLNNLQYIFYEKFRIFQYSSELMRSGHLRYLVGGFFTIFSPLVALSQYLTRRKKIFLAAFIYMMGTAVIQGQTRTVIWGFLMTTLIILYLAKRIDLKRVFLIGIPIGVLFFLLLPVIQSTRWGEFYQLTRQEIVNREGNWGGRLEAYDYYLGEVLKSPLIGRGIWNEAYDVELGDNLEVRRSGGFGLADVGIMALLFRFGLIGAIWLFLLISKVFRSIFTGFSQSEEPVPYLVASYFLFGLATLLTIDCFIQQEVIIYLALNLALLSHINGSVQGETVS